MKHQFHPACRICHWWYCAKCGEIQLKNVASRKAWAKLCPGAEKDEDREVTVIKK